jgi:hypothetical protein
VLPGSGVTVTGSGSATNPYVISAAPDLATRLEVVDTDTVDMHAAGSGTDDDPLVLSADVTMGLDGLTDVTAPDPAPGDSITWNGSAWVAAPPAVVPPGAVNVGAGLTGTGAIEAPLAAAVSGVWGVSPLDVYGDDSAAGLAIYVDSNGQLRGEPRVPTIAYDDLTGVPTTFPTTWDQVAGKPSSWPVVATTTSLTQASGWRVNWGNAHRTGAVVTVTFSVTRTGASITSPESNGNMGNQRMATIAAALRPFQYGPFTTASTGPLMTGYVDSNGSMFLTATVPNYRFATGATLVFTGTWVCRGG